MPHRTAPASVLAAPFVAAALVFGLAEAAWAGVYTIGGSPYSEDTPTENLTAAFTSSTGAATTNLYSGFVRIDVSGMGQALGASFNDAFYDVATQVHDGNFYQLVITKTGSVAVNSADDAYRKIVYDLTTDMEVAPPYTPAYQASHMYSFIIDTSLLAGAASSILRFGVNDGSYGDNSGSYSVTVTQLILNPEPSTIAIFGLGALGLGVAVRRRRARIARSEPTATAR